MSTTELAPTSAALAPTTPVEVAYELCDDDVIMYVDPATLLDSPFQPRTIYNEAKLREGAETMMPPRGRMLQPMVVRDVSEAARPLFSGIDTVVTYELVFGHRRKRMALMAGLRRAPVIVRKMTDEEVKIAQIIENLQRDDVHAFDEAEGMEKLMKEHGKTADQIVEDTGKSRSYVYGRLKLLQACPEIRKSCLAGEIDAEVALLIARLRTDKLQQKALQYIKGKFLSLDDGGAKSYRQIRDLLKEHFTLDLKTALFDVTAEFLLPGAGACTTCPKRTCNAPEYEDLLQPRKDAWRGNVPGNPNLCTDPDCFDSKKVMHLKIKAQELQDKGKTVIDGNKARVAIGADGRVKGAYIALADVKGELEKIAKASKGPGAKPFPLPAPEVVTIQNPRDGKLVQAVRIDELKLRGVKVSDAHTREVESSKQREARQRAKEEADEATAAKTRDFHVELLDRTLAAMENTERQAQDLYLVVMVALGGMDYRVQPYLAARWDQPSFNALKAHAGQLDVKQLNRLLMECALAENVFTTPWALNAKPEALFQAAKRYGISLTAMLAESALPAKPAPTPSPAARAKKDAKAKPNASNAKRPAARYKNQATGETWSGRGLMPKWLKVATAAGAKLTDFEQGSDQAGSAGNEKGAGVAGDEGLQGEEQGAEA